MDHNGTVHLMTKPEMARQGDVLLVPLKKRPPQDSLGEVLMEGSRLVLAHGEVTGHAHAIYPERDIAEEIHTNPEPATLYEFPGVADWVDTAATENAMFLEARERCLLRHEEHQTISLAPGNYAVLRQMEFPEDRKPRRVMD